MTRTPSLGTIATATLALSALLAAAAFTRADPGAEKSWTVTPAGQTADPDYSKYGESIHLPYAPAGRNKALPDFDHLSGLNVRMSIDGGPAHTFLIDTGSCGIVVGDTDVPDIDPNAPAGSVVYGSSGNGYYGKWTMATVTFPDAKDANGHAATAVVPVLAADTYKFAPGAVNGGSRAATQKAHPHPYMLGIGSGRGPENTQFRNPWLNLKAMQAGTMRRGYTIGRDGVTLGLTPADAREFVFEKLNPHVGRPTTWPTVGPVPKDWDASTGYLVVDGRRMETSWMLLDTGLTNFMLEYPEVGGKAIVPAGTKIEVRLVGGKLGYAFTVGDAGPSTPNKPNPPAGDTAVSWTHREGPPMVNTGLRPLAGFDYLYDADGGYAGLRPTTRPAP